MDIFDVFLESYLRLQSWGIADEVLLDWIRYKDTKQPSPQEVVECLDELLYLRSKFREAGYDLKPIGV